MKTKTLQEVRTKAEFSVAHWESITARIPDDWKKVSHVARQLEVGGGHIANLRGTLKNSSANQDMIEWLASCVEFRIKRIKELTGLSF